MPAMRYPTDGKLDAKSRSGRGLSDRGRIDFASPPPGEPGPSPMGRPEKPLLPDGLMDKILADSDRARARQISGEMLELAAKRVVPSGFYFGWMLGDALGLGKTWDPLGLAGPMVFSAPGYDLDGYTKLCSDAPLPGYSGRWAQQSGIVPACGLTSGYFGKPSDLVFPTYPNSFNVNEVIYDQVLNFTSTHVIESWAVSPGDPVEPIPKLSPGIYIAPATIPSDSPEELPILQPAEVFPQTFREAVAVPGSQPSPDDANRPIEVPVPDYPIALVDIVPGRLVVPDQSVDIDPDTRPTDPQPEPGDNPGPGDTTAPPGDAPPELKPPRAREKQRKINVRSIGFGSNIWVLGNLLSEGLEAVDDLWRSLPRECKTRRWRMKPNGKRGRRSATPYEKAQDLYRCWRHMDVAKAVENVMNDQVSDIFYAIQGRLGTKATQRLNINTGLQHMLREGQKEISQQAIDAGADEKETQLPLPRLSHDERTNEWFISWSGHKVSVGKHGKPGQTVGEVLDDL